MPSSFTMKVQKAGNAERTQASALLTTCDLPLDGLEETELWCVKGSGRRLVAVAGLETRGEQSLLRSVAVEKEHRNSGVGGRLVSEVLAAARSRGVKEVYLITESAPLFFRRFGFRNFARERVKGDVLQSAEFRGACPESAPVMRIVL